MIDKDILDGLAELDEADLKRIKLLVDNKLNLHKKTKVFSSSVTYFVPNSSFATRNYTPVLAIMK